MKSNRWDSGNWDRLLNIDLKEMAKKLKVLKKKRKLKKKDDLHE